MDKWRELIVLGAVCLALVGLGIAMVCTKQTDQLPLVVNAVVALLGYAGGVARGNRTSGTRSSLGDVGTGAIVVALGGLTGYGSSLLCT